MSAVSSIESKETAVLRLNPLIKRVGNTPMIPLTEMDLGLAPGVRLLLKAEWLNPTGSIKDRPAAAILRSALVSPSPASRTLLDSSSGNMAIGYATFAPRRGLAPLHMVVPENISPLRLRTLLALGVELTFSDPLEGSEGARVLATEMAQADPERFHYLDQYSNPANPAAHFEGTGPEIARQTQGEVTHLIAGLGTGGTLTGAGRYLRGLDRSIELIAVQPDSPLHGLEGLKHYASTPVPEIYDASLADRTVEVATEQAYAMVRRLARQAGLLVGISSGAAVLAAVEVARQLDRGAVVAICPDSASRYLQEPFWEADE